MRACNCTMFCCTLLYVHASNAIILMGKRELVALLILSSWCLVMVERFFLAVPRGCLPFVIVVFPDHTHYFLHTASMREYPSSGSLRTANGQTSLCSLISTFVIGLLESIISILATSKISIFYLVSVAKQACLNLTLGNPEDRFCRVRAHIKVEDDPVQNQTSSFTS